MFFGIMGCFLMFGCRKICLVTQSLRQINASIIDHDMISLNMSCVKRKTVFGFLTKSDTNQADG